MEELIWKIYQGLKNAHVLIVISALGVMGWIFQNNLNIQLDDNANQVLNIIAQSLITLTALICAIVIFGFESIKTLVEGSRDNNMESLKSGWEIGKDKLMKFSVYNFFVVTLNLFIIIFFRESNKFSLSILFIDIGLTLYSFHLVIKLMDKVLDTHRDLIQQ